MILVHYRTPQLLAKSVEALTRELDSLGMSAEITVVDNGSSAAEAAALKRLPVRYIDAGSNLGYARGINLGASAARAKFMVFMNPDVEVRSGCLAHLVLELDRGAAAAGPRFFLDPESRFVIPPTEERTRRAEMLRHLARINSRASHTARRRWRSHARRHWGAEGAIDSYSLSGALLAVRADAWSAIGPFDGRYQLYYEETDWLLRLRAKGLKARYVPDAEATHLYNRSGALEPRAREWFRQSARLFEREYYGTSFSWGLNVVGRVAEAMGSDRRVPDNLAQVQAVLAAQSGGWLECSETPLGFPAAGCRLQRTDLARAGEDFWNGLPAGQYFVRVADDNGGELAAGRVTSTGQSRGEHE